ncbi:MAG: PH domain-containing protein [Thermoprotei archaeon]|jgi:uncharacterized membrane protein YdbT with pleckstrin-like domain
METLKFRPTLRAYAPKMVISTLLFALVISAVFLYRRALLDLRGGIYLFALIVLLDAVFLLAEVLPPLIYVRSHAYFVGDGKVEEIAGMFSRSVKTISIAQIREMEAKQGAFGRLMGYGDLTVLSGLGMSEGIRMSPIKDPVKVKAYIEELMKKSTTSGQGSSSESEKQIEKN